RVVATGHDGDEAVIVRLLGNGAPDPDFGSSGFIGTVFKPLWSEPGWTPEAPRMPAVTVMTDGSILTAGTGSGCSVEPDCRFAIAWRVSATGEPLPLDEDDDGTWAESVEGLKTVA